MRNLLREKMKYDNLIICKVDKGQTSMITFELQEGEGSNQAAHDYNYCNVVEVK